MTCFILPKKPRRVCARRRKESRNHFLRRRVRRRKYRSARKRAKGVPFVRCSEPQPLSNESPVKRVSFDGLYKNSFFDKLCRNAVFFRYYYNVPQKNSQIPGGFPLQPLKKYVKILAIQKKSCDRAAGCRMRAQRGCVAVSTPRRQCRPSPASFRLNVL